MFYLKQNFITFLLVFFAFSNVANSQTSVFLSGKVAKDFNKEFAIKKCGLNYTGEDKSLIVKTNKQYGFQQSFLIDKPSFYKIPDLFSEHTIFLEPGDSVHLNFTLIPNIDIKLSAGESVSKKYILTASSKYPKNITFFDEYDAKFKVLKYKFEQPLVFKNKCQAVYEQATQMLKFYLEKNQISQTFYSFAMEELEAKRLMSFCTMLSQKNLPNSIEIIGSFLPKKYDNLMYSTASDDYLTSSALYTYYIANPFDAKNYYSNLKGEFNSIFRNYTGVLRDKLSGWHIEDYLDKSSLAFDSCYFVFLDSCRNLLIKNNVKAKVEEFRKKASQFPIKGINLALAIKNAKVVRKDGKVSNFEELFKDTLPILIDCWATWCVPCQIQMNATREMEEKYTGIVNFIYLSFDADIKKWQNFSKTNKAKNFLLLDGFTSPFTEFLKIKSIPRYILLSHDGSLILNNSLSMPALTEDFSREIEVALLVSHIP